MRRGGYIDRAIRRRTQHAGGSTAFAERFSAALQDMIAALMADGMSHSAAIDHILSQHPEAAATYRRLAGFGGES